MSVHKAQRFFASKGVDPIKAARNLGDIEVFSHVTPQEEFQSVGLEESLQYAHDMIVLSAVEEANQMSIQSYLDFSNMTMATEWNNSKAEILRQLGIHSGTTGGSSFSNGFFGGYEADLESDSGSDFLKRGKELTPRVMGFANLITRYCERRLPFLEKAMNGQANAASIEPFLFPILPETIRILSSTNEMNETERMRVDMTDTFNLLASMIKRAASYMGGTPVSLDAVPYRYFNRAFAAPNEVSSSSPLFGIESNFPHLLRSSSAKLTGDYSDRTLLPFSLSPLSLPVVCGEASSSLSSSSSSSSATAHASLVSDAFRLQRGLILGAAEFFEEQFSAMMAAVVAHPPSTHSPRRGDQQTFISCASAFCSIKHRGCSTLIQQPSSVSFAPLALTPLDKAISPEGGAMLTMTQVGAHREAEWPLALQCFTADGLPLWPLVYFCLRSGRLLDAVALLSEPTVSAVSSPAFELPSSLEAISTLSPHTDPDASLCLQLLVDYLHNNNSLSLSAQHKLDAAWGSSSSSSSSSSNSGRAIADEKDLYKVAVFQVIGRKESTRTTPFPFATRQDFLWSRLLMVSREEDLTTAFLTGSMAQPVSSSASASASASAMTSSSSSLTTPSTSSSPINTLSSLAQMVNVSSRSQYDLSGTNKWPFVQSLIATQQFELAVSALSEIDPLLQSLASSSSSSSSSFESSSFGDVSTTSDAASVLVNSRSAELLCGAVHLQRCLSFYGLLNEDYEAEDVMLGGLPQSGCIERGEQGGVNASSMYTTARSVADIAAQSLLVSKQNLSSSLVQPSLNASSAFGRSALSSSSSSSPSSSSSSSSTTSTASAESSLLFVKPAALSRAYCQRLLSSHPQYALAYAASAHPQPFLTRRDPSVLFALEIVTSSNEYDALFGSFISNSSSSSSSSSLSDLDSTTSSSSSSLTIHPSQPRGILFSLFPSSVCSLLSSLSAERCADEGRPALALRLLLFYSQGEEERAYSLASECLTPCLLSPPGTHPHRENILRILRTYLTQPPSSNSSSSSSSSSPRVALLRASIISAVKIAQASDEAKKQNYALALQCLDDSGILPRSSAEIAAKTELLSNYLLPCLSRNISGILSLAVNTISSRYNSILTEQKVSSLKSSSLNAQQHLANLKERADTLVSFVGQIPSESVARVHMEIIKTVSMMH
ncbi:putative Nup93/Nic96 [Monocercomonoides exilis]|uniref:putative Nup93/Nic96 n=1 Tax=Monocercomonoides exilis TaxID=2049356 RepID=UPI00355A28F8|nr:putative Nup93/Nic96 [Monocercomonoides exilis]